MNSKLYCTNVLERHTRNYKNSFIYTAKLYKTSAILTLM